MNELANRTGLTKQIVIFCNWLRGPGAKVSKVVTLAGMGLIFAIQACTNRLAEVRAEPKLVTESAEAARLQTAEGTEAITFTHLPDMAGTIDGGVKFDCRPPSGVPSRSVHGYVDGVEARKTALGNGQYRFEAKPVTPGWHVLAVEAEGRRYTASMRLLHTTTQCDLASVAPTRKAAEAWKTTAHDGQLWLDGVAHAGTSTGCSLEQLLAVGESLRLELRMNAPLKADSWSGGCSLVIGRHEIAFDDLGRVRVAVKERDSRGASNSVAALYASPAKARVRPGEWFTLRVERLSSSTNTIACYVNDEQVVAFDTSYSPSEELRLTMRLYASSIGRVSLLCRAMLKGKHELDADEKRQLLSETEDALRTRYALQRMWRLRI